MMDHDCLEEVLYRNEKEVLLKYSMKGFPQLIDGVYLNKDNLGLDNCVQSLHKYDRYQIFIKVVLEIEIY